MMSRVQHSPMMVIVRWVFNARIGSTNEEKKHVTEAHSERVKTITLGGPNWQ
jgi:hypothetical protein